MEGQVPDEKLALAYGFEVTRPRQDKVANQFFEWKRSARIERKVRFQLTLKRNQEAIAKAEAKTGWRIYATNAPVEKFPLAKTVLAYRDQYIVENVFRRLQGKILSITPVYVQRDDYCGTSSSVRRSSCKGSSS
ncbi:MAG: hypothetical protein B5M51_08200 [Anaerolinea sp. 4484_236]|nr:MAG: hypothetical protein B5M51_08200 [Anaerolinea sp. 4484_236]